LVTLQYSIDKPLRSLFDPVKGTISREIYVNQAIYQQELEQIWARCWILLGHESQVPNPGDFAICRMGEEEVIMVRDRKDKKVHAFLNSCRHKGMKVCRYDDGNTLVFTCPFHGWSYDTDGRLVGVAYYADAYNGELDKSQWGLKEVAQLCNYYGSIWATWDPKAPSFEDYLGPWGPSLRHVMQSTDGEDNGVEIFNPVIKWRLPTNWKFPAFSSSTDPTHAAMTHRSVNVAAIGPQGDTEGGDRSPLRNPFPKKTNTVGDHNLGHGGHYTTYLQTGVPEYRDTWFTDPGVDEYFRETSKKKAIVYKDKIMPGNGHGASHFAVWPSFIIDHWRIRPWHPHGVGVTERHSMYAIDKNAPKHVKDAMRHYVMRYNGPTGVTESDDMENWNYAFPASLGTMAQKLPYNFEMAMGVGKEDGFLPGVTFTQRLSEESGRARFSRWLAFMEANSWDDLYPVNKAAFGKTKLFP
jgi:phenylpropionate dioxygenase-like ring-hydroxylating dioxygenase large terminal subunit